MAVGTCTLAADQAGNGGTSPAPQVTQSFAVTQGTQAITDFAPPSPITYGPGLSFALTATGGASSNPVVFASATPATCTVANSIASVQSAGLCTLSANQAGDTNYTAAPQANASVVIEQVVQSIVFNDLPDRTFGELPFGLTASATSGLPVSFTTTTAAVCTVTNTTVTLVAPGTCSIEAGQGGNVNTSAAVPVMQSFTVNPASQSIVFGVLPGMRVGDASTTLSATATSGLTVSFTTTTAAVCTVVDATVTPVGQGICTVQADQAGDGRYSAALPVMQSFAVVPAGIQVYYIHTDHLNTPRVIMDSGNNPVWRWDNGEAFGNNAPDENPSGLGNFTYNPRFAGQYADRETGLFYNYFRDCYDPQTGRYCQSDPIGLAGGSLSTYTYANNNPLSWIDPLGLDAIIAHGGTLTYYNNNGGIVGTYSYTTGRPGITDTTISGQGPIPLGIYTADPKQISEGGFFRNLLGDWGKFRVPLQPDSSTKTFGRNGFFLHGGKKPGSAGCIDVGGSDTDLFKHLQNASGLVPVVVY